MATPAEIVDDLVGRLNTLGLIADNATTTAPGRVQLAGDLGGTATAPTVPGLSGKAATSHTHAGHNLTPNRVTMAANEYLMSSPTNLVVNGSTWNQIATAPLGDEYHDLLAFHNRSVPVFQTSAAVDGTGFAADTLVGDIFANIRNPATSAYVDGTTKKAMRWTWASGMPWGSTSFVWLILNIPYISATNPNYTVAVESSADGTAWTSRHLSAGNLTQQGVIMCAVSTWNGDPQLRVTVTVTNSVPMRVGNMKLLVPRPDMGVNPDGPPLVWDVAKKVGLGTAAVPSTGVVRIGDDTTTAAGGLQLGSDTVIYRESANVFRTTGTIIANQVRSAATVPVVSSDLTRKDYVDAQVAGRVLSIAGTNSVYIKNGAGADALTSFTSSATANTAMFRTTGGVTSVGEPTASTHAATKNYVDTTAELVARKGAANGYAPLDANGFVPSTNLPSYVDDVLEYADLAGLPATGTTGKIYVTLDTGKIYRWSGSAYVEISPSPGSTDSVTEGSTNKYYTDARAIAANASAIAAKVTAYTGQTPTLWFGNTAAYDALATGTKNAAGFVAVITP